eukprot:m.114565 g.114565  ORF g.114565 m.114565 type:complete len:201 (+) comp13543_c0_seq4:322-924(+)
MENIHTPRDAVEYVAENPQVLGSIDGDGNPFFHQVVRSRAFNVPPHAVLQALEPQLHEHGMARQLALAVDPAGRSALHYAALQSDLEACTWLVRFGSFINAQDSKGFTPLHFCSAVSVARYLLSQGANPSIRSRGGMDVPTFMKRLDCPTELIALVSVSSVTSAVVSPQPVLWVALVVVLACTLVGALLYASKQGSLALS